MAQDYKAKAAAIEVDSKSALSITASWKTRRASDTKAASRHLPPGSGDVGPDARAGPVHEVQERLVLHPRGHRLAAEAGGRAAVGVDRRAAAKAGTDPAPRRADRSPPQPSPVADARAGSPLAPPGTPISVIVVYPPAPGSACQRAI